MVKGGSSNAICNVGKCLVITFYLFLLIVLHWNFCYTESTRVLAHLSRFPRWQWKHNQAVLGRVEPTLVEKGQILFGPSCQKLEDDYSNSLDSCIYKHL